MNIRAIESLSFYEKEEIDKRVKNYILFCLKHNDKNMRQAAANIINVNFPAYKDMLDKYMVLL